MFHVVFFFKLGGKIFFHQLLLLLSIFFFFFVFIFPKGGLQMYVNNSLYTDIGTLTNVTRIIGENLRASKKSPNCVQVVFQSGTGVEFCEDKGLMSFVVSLSKDYFNKTKGLFGTYNKDPDDDFTLPNGTVLSPDITSRDIHFKFGLNCEYFSGF